MGVKTIAVVRTSVHPFIRVHNIRREQRPQMLSKRRWTGEVKAEAMPVMCAYVLESLSVCVYVFEWWNESCRYCNARVYDTLHVIR